MSPHFREARLNLPDEIGLSYLAGIVDGEGCISRRAANGAYSVQVVNTDWRLIERLLAVGGTSCSMRSKNPAHLPKWVWTLGALVDVREFLDAISPYLLLKRERAVEAIAACSLTMEQRFERERLPI